MRKHAFALVGVLALMLIAVSALAESDTTGEPAHTIGLENFIASIEYADNHFVDVKDSDWYADNIRHAFQYGLLVGKKDGYFDPLGDFTIAEAITVASRISSIYLYGDAEFDSYGYGYWYEPYVDYAKELSIITSDYADYNIPATRAEVAKILAMSIDFFDLLPCNIVDDGAIPDVDMDADYADAVYLLYRAGVLTGSDEMGSFLPDATITRAEAAAIITRIVDPTLRKTVELTGDY